MEAIRDGRVISSPARAIRVRIDVDPETKEPHSAIVANVTILTDNKTDAQKLVDAWQEMAHAILLKADELLSREKISDA